MDMFDFGRYFAALLLILGLLAGFAFILRRAQAQGLLPGFVAQRRTERRMRTVESLLVDAKRRLVIVEIDDREHVLLLGAERETVLHSGPALPVFEPEMPDEAPAHSHGESGIEAVPGARTSADTGPDDQAQAQSKSQSQSGSQADRPDSESEARS